MLNNKKNNFYDYCVQSPQEVGAALVQLSKLRNEIEKTNGWDMESFYSYVDVILSIAFKGNKIEQKWESVLKFLDKDLILSFIKKPVDAYAHADITMQLITVAAGMGVMIEPMPYDQDDLLAMQEGTYKHYHDVPFAYTLNRIFEGGEDVADLAEVLLGFLQFGNKEPERGEQIKWESAFLLNLLMHAVWRHFSSLSDEGKKLLLDHYVYIAIVGGVPVRSYLKNFVFSVGDRSAEKEDYIIDSLLANKEEIPFDTACAQWKLLPEILRSYTATLGNEPSSGFKQEEFLRGFYQGQKNRDIFRNWLREALNVISNLGM